MALLSAVIGLAVLAALIRWRKQVDEAIGPFEEPWRLRSRPHDWD